MSATQHEFRFSEEFIARQRTYMLALFLPILLVLVASVIVPAIRGRPVMGSLGGTLTVTGILVALWGSTVPLTLRYVFQTWRKMRLLVHEGGLLKVSGQVEEAVAWCDLTRLRRHEGPTGDVLALQLTLSDGRTLQLFGFDDMSRIAGLLEGKLTDSSSLDVKRTKIDYQSPLVGLIIGLVAGAFGVGSYQLFARGGNAQAVFCSACPLGVGALFVAGKPVSRSNPNFRRFELILGWALIALGALNGLLRYLPDF